MMVGGSKYTVIFTVVVSLALLQVIPSFASPVSWDGGGDGTDWFDPDNWDSDALPLGSDDITIGGNSDVDLGDQFLITSGSLAIEEGSSLFMTEESPTVILGVGGLLVNNGTITVSNEVEITGTMINNGDITIQLEFDDANPQIFVVDEEGIFVNYGNILIAADAALENFNLLINLGTITVESDGRYENGYSTTNEAVFNILEGGSVNNELNFTNNGAVINEGSFTGGGNQDILTNNGGIENGPSGFFGMGSESVFENGGSFVNSGSVFLTRAENDGLIFNLEYVEAVGLVSVAGNFTNNGTIDLTGEVQVSENGLFRNDGQVTFGRDFGGEGTDEGSIANDGTMQNNNLMEIVIGSITNTGTLTNNGEITSQDTISNSGNGRMRNVGTIQNDGVISNAGNGRITNAGTITNNNLIDNQSIFNSCGTVNGNVPQGGIVNGFCPAKIIVIKDTVPNASTDFEFTSATLVPAVFSLDDDSQGPLQNTREFEDLAPGTYDVTEAFNPSYITLSDCDDGSPVGAISAQDDETITCTFTNLHDSDLDGLAPDIDTSSLFSNDFSDASLGNGGKTNGTVTGRGSLTVWVTDEPNPDGVRIRALNGPSQNATISVCSGTSDISVNDGDEVVVTCGSVSLASVSGNPLIFFNSQQGIRSSVNLPQGNGIFFEPSTFRFSAPAENSATLPVEIMAAARIIVELPQSEHNSFTFEPQTATFTSGADNQGEISIIIGDKEEKVPPDSSVSPLIAIDQSFTMDENQHIQIVLSSIGGVAVPEATFEVTLPPAGLLIQDEQNTAQITYTPNSGFVGVDRFEFRAVQAGKESNAGTVTITVLEKKNLVKQKITGAYLGKFDEMSFASLGNFKLGKGNFKKVSLDGEFEAVKNGAKCFDVTGAGMMDFKKGNVLNLEFSAKTCNSGFLSRLDGTVDFVGGTGMFDGAEGEAKFSQVNLRNKLVGKLDGNVFLNKP